MKLIRRILGILIAVYGVVLAVTPRLIAPVCEYGRSMMESAEPVMKCHYLVGVSVGFGLMVLLLGLALAFLPRGFVSGTGVGLAAVGIVYILLPVCFVGVCADMNASCYLQTRTVMEIMGAVTVVIGLIAAVIGGLADAKLRRRLDSYIMSEYPPPPPPPPAFREPPQPPEGGNE